MKYLFLSDASIPGGKSDEERKKSDPHPSDLEWFSVPKEQFEYVRRRNSKTALTSVPRSTELTEFTRKGAQGCG